MAGSRLDNLARNLATGAETRRTLLRGAVAGVVGIALAQAGGEGAEARHCGRRGCCRRRQAYCYGGCCRRGWFCCGRRVCCR